MRQPSVSLAVSLAEPAGKNEQAFMHSSVVRYCWSFPVHVAWIAVQ
jgi:hypothetical protein